MPPKKKGKGKKSSGSGGSASSKAMDEKAKEATMAMFHQLDQEKIHTLTSRFDECYREKVTLKKQVEKGEKETHEFVSYFQKELEQRDETIATLKDRISHLEETHDQEVATVKEGYMKKLVELTEDRGKSEVGLRARVAVLEEELQTLEAFRETRADMERRIKELEAEIHRLEQEHVQQMTNQERKFLGEKARMQRELEQRLEAMRAEEKDRIAAGQAVEARRIVAENKRLREELRFQQEMTEELKANKRKVEETNRKLARDVEIGTEKEQEYARQAHSRSKQVQALTEKISVMESLLKDAGRKFSDERSQLARSMRKELNEQTTDADGLRHVLRLKNRELQTIKAHAATILEQRTEVERFFLESLEQCKKQIVEERQRSYRAALADYRAQMKKAATSRGETFPSIKTKTDIMNAEAQAQSNLPVAPSTKVQLSDLTWGDREKILRLLFAKINAVHTSVRSMPEHSLQAEGFAMSQPAALR